MATEAADIPDPISLTQKRDGVEDRELTSELSYTIVNEVPMEEEKKKVESSVNQPPETIEILEKTEHMQVVNGKEVPNVNVVDEGNVGNIEGEIFLKSSSVSDEKPMRNTEENQSITKEELSDLQDEKGCITDKNIIVEGSYAKAGPDVGDNLEEKTSMAYEDRSQEIVELSEKMKDVTTIDDEVQNKNFESSFVEKLEDISFQKVDNLETSKEESEAGMKYIVKESPDEADDQNEILRNIATTDRNLSTTGKVDENPEPKAEEGMRESEDLTPPEALTMECKHERLMVLASEGNAEDTEQEKTETSKHEEHSVQSFVQKNEPAKANLGSPLDVTSEEIETPPPSEYAETMTNIEEQRPVGIPQEILGETRQDETIIADDINKNENPEAKNVSTVDVDEKTRSMEVEISSKNGNELYVTHPPIEETVKVEGEKQDEVSMSESGGRLHEVFEVPMEEATRVNETFEASKSPEGIILEHTSTEGALNMEVTLATSELNINPEKGCELNSEKELKEINAEENIKEETEQKEKAFDTEIQIATKSDDNEKSTTEEVVPVKNTTLCPGEEEYHHDQEDKNETLSSKEASPKLDTGDQGCRTSNETKNINDQIINEEAIQVYEDVKIADRGENTEKEMENEEHTVMDRSPESNGKHTTKCSQENEMDAEKQKAKIGEELETTNKSEVIEKQILAEENRVQDGLTVSAGEEFGTESSKEDDMTTKMSKEEVLEILQTADGSANIGIQTKKEDGTSKDKFVARDGEETKNECSYGKDEEKESDIEISLMNEDLNAQSITRSSEEETAQKESNLDIIENSSSVPEISEKVIKEEKDDSQVTMVAEETSLTEVEEKYKMPVDSSDMVSVEMGLLTTETSEMESNDIDNTEKPTETLNLNENEAMEILTASKHGADETAEKTEPEGKNESCDAISKTQNQREIATAETFLDEISDQNLQASSTLSVEEHNIVTPVSEATSEAPEKDKTLYGKEETPIVGETTEEDKMEEDESTNPKNDTKMEPIEIEKESANDDAQNEDPELYTPPEVNHEKSISESDVELLNRVNTSEVTNCGEMGKLETSEDKMPSDTGIEKDKSEYKTEVNEATKGVEADGGCTDTDKDILEHEDSAKDFEGSSKNSIEIEKAPVEFEIEGHSHGSEASETKSISTLTEKNIETVEHGENHRSAPDSMVEDDSNRRIPDTNQANIPEESHDDENHTTDSTKEQISGQDIEEESTKMNEEIEPKLESQKEINKTQDTILNEKAPSEIERAVETEIIEEQTMQEESCTKELHMIPEADETVHEVRELDLTSIGSLETTSSNNNTEMVKSKVEEDLNQESKAMNEDINEPIEKPVNVLSSVSEVSAEKIEEENIEDTENCDDNADTAPTVVTDVTSLGEFQLNGEPVEAIDTSSDAKNLEATKPADSSQHDAEVDSMKIEGTSSIELQLPVHEHEKADDESITLEKSDANDVEVEETKIPEESKDQDVKEIHQTGTSLTVEETDANEIEKQIREVPEALPQPINQAIEADIGAEIISPTVATEVTNLGEVQLNDESVKVLDTSSDAKSLERTKTADDNQQDAEVDSLKLQETSSVVYQLPMQEHEKEDNVSVTVEKSDANDVEAKETKIPETVPESKDQGIKETHETGTSLIVGVIDANETEKQIGEVPEALSEPINKGVEAARDEEITLGQTLQAEKIEEPLQVPSSSLISEKQDSETTTTIEKSEDESTKKDDTQVDNLKHEENYGMVSELPITVCESANNETVEKLDADEVEAKETETLEAVSESKDQGFQEIHETRTSPTTENTESDKIEEGVDAVADDETSDHPHPVGKLEEQLQVSSSALNCETSTTSKMDDESTKKDETEVDKIEPEEATGMLSKSPTIEYENADADEVHVETKTYKAISESTGDDVEEIHERIQPSTDTEDEENKGLEMPCDSTKDDYMSKDIACPDNQKTDKVIETSEAAGDTLDSSLFTAPIEDECSEKPVQDVKGNLEENSSMACEDGSQETVVLSEKMKDVTSIEDEVQNQNLSFFVKEVEDICLQKADSPETSKEESETGMKDIVNESQNEEDNRNDILENIVTPDTNLSTIGKDDENPEPKPDASFREPNESMRRESEDIIPTEELTTECQQEGFMVVAGEDNIVAAQQYQPETSNHEEHSEKSSFMQETEPATANLGSPLDVASGEIETTAPNEYAEMITNIEEQRMDGIPQKILGETREDEIKEDENPEGKNLSTVDLDEKTRSTEVEIPNKNDNELYVTHPTVEETVQLGVEKQDEVSMSESGDQLHEAFEVPTEEEKHVNETYKASKSPQSTILDHTSIGEALNMDVTSTTNELDINLEHGSELNSEKEVKDINAEETIKEEIEQKEKASDTEIQISTRSDDNERSTIEEKVTVKNDTPLCTGEEDYHHDQEDKIGPNSSKEASIELDSGDQSCRTSSETKNVNDHIINEETIQEYEDPKITDRGEEAEKEMKIEDHTEMGQKLETTSKSEGIEKQVLAEESRDQDWPTVSAGEELGTESPQEDAMKTKTSKKEVLEILQTADGSANIGIQTKEEDGTSKDNFVACDGEEIKNGYSCDKENEDKEPDTVVPREIERATESEIIEEQTTEEESCTKEPQMIAVADETINEMRDLDLTPIQSLETTASNDNTEMVKSKLAEDLNQESEASSMKITTSDEIKKPIEKPVNVSSLVSEVSEEKFEEENIEDTENCDDDTNIAPTVLTDVTNLGEVQLNDKPVKALDTSSDAKSLEPATIADTSQHDAEVDSMKLESDANDVEAEGTKIPDSVSESKDQGVKEIHETDTSLTVGETETNEIDKQIREVPEALSEPLNQGVETASNDEIIAPTVAIEVTSVGKVQVNDEPVNALDTSSDAKSLETTKAADIIQQDEEVDSMRPKEASTMVYQLPIHEHEKAGNEISVEKSDANDDEVEELKISDAVPDSKDQCVKEFNKTGTSLIMGETDANEIEKQIREVPKGLSEPINQGVEADRDDEITPGQTLQAEKIDEQLQEEQLQVPSSSLISMEQDSETTTTIEKSEDGSTKKDDTQVDNLKPVESSGMVSELPITNCESANNETVEKLDADEVEVEETKTLDAVSESKDQGFEEIHETGTSQTTENALTDKIEQEIQEANEKISDPIYQGVDSVVDGETSDHPLPLGTLEDESTKEDESEIDNIELVEATGMLSKLPAIEHKNADMSATIEKSDANEVQVEESKTSEAISESKVHGVEEIHEIGPSLTVGNTHIDKVEEIKEAPDTIFKPAYQCVEAVIDRDITINQTLPTQRNEKLQEPSSALPKEQNHETPTNVELIKDESTKKDETQPNENVAYSFPTSITEKPCLQDEGPRELDVSNLELKAQESQNKAPEEESIALEETSTVEPQEYIPEIKCADCPMEYEIIPIQCSSQGTSKDEDIINSGDSNKESDNLPPPYAAVKNLLQGEVGEMCEEASNLKFEKTAKVLESVSEIYSPEVTPTSEGIEIIEEQLKGVITETRDGKNHSEETTEADEAIKKDNSNGKAIDEEHKQITEENSVARNSHPVSPHEETVTKSNQEDELRAEDYPGKRTNITFEIIENEIQHEEMFEESEEAGEDKYIKETTTTEDQTFKDGKVSVGDGTTNVSPPEEAEDGKNIEKVPNRLDRENQGDETNFEDAATEATAPIKEFKPSEVMLVSHEEDRTYDNDEETVMRNDEHLQNTDLVVPPVIDAAAEEAPDEKVRENFEEVSEPAPKGPTHRTIETYEENKEIASADTNNSENLMDNDKLESRFLQPACEESGVREDMNLKEQEVSSNIPSISSCAATSHEKIADKESEKTADKKDGFVSDKQTTEAVSILEQEKSIQFEEKHTKDEEPVELSTMGNERKLDETKIHSTTTTNGDEETQYQNEKPNVLSHIKDSSREVSHEKGIMDLDKVNEITEGTQDLEKTSIAISQEQIARRANPTESAETTNSTASKDIPQMQDDPTTKIFQNPEIEDLKAGYAAGFEPEATGVECGEEKRMGEESEETTEKSVMIESAEFSLSDFMHGSRKQTLPVVEHLTEERELTGNKEEPQTESAERVQVEETKTEEGKDEYEEGDEHKRADSGSDAPVMVEASTDTDVKIVHKKHHNILSGVGSKVKHSLAKMKKAITGKSSHPKTPSAVK
ncbi:hypothetical protein ACSBR2_022584 [Camellia fascicularis]